MSLNDDELKYKNVINALKGLQEVKAPNNFEADLMRRINSEKFEEKKQSFWKRIFLPSRLIPSAALAVSAVILLFVININSDESENPLLMEPKVRKDVIQTTAMSDKFQEKSESNENNRSLSQDKDIAEFRDESSDSGEQQNMGSFNYSSNGFAINKDGLNFRQINLSNEEKQRLNELRQHFRKLLQTSNSN